MMYNINTMSDVKKDEFIKITQSDYLDLMIDTCSQVICFEYESKCCNCKTPRDCHGYYEFTESAKSHVVVAKEGDKIKLIRFGQQGKTGDKTMTKRAKSFKARHRKNIKKGKMSAAYWANRVKW